MRSYSGVDFRISVSFHLSKGGAQGISASGNREKNRRKNENEEKYCRKNGNQEGKRQRKFSIYHLKTRK